MATKKQPEKKKDINISDGKKLVIVESPGKVKTISKYLWSDYQVKASVWHIADLVDKNMDKLVSKWFEPDYEISPTKKKVVTELKKLVKTSDQVILATDEDREWEAIAYHLANFLKLDIDSTPRIAFNEITKPAILDAIKHPRSINLDLVHAQKSRAVLDKLVWFSISPVLRRKIKSWLSAGRVQSVAVKLIIEKEREIQAHVPIEYRQLQAECVYEDNKGKSHPITIFLKKIDDTKKRKWSKEGTNTADSNDTNLNDSEDNKNKDELVGSRFTKEQMNEVLDKLWLGKSDYKISTDKKTWNEVLISKKTIKFELIDIITKSSKRTPPAPFITSTLQSTWSRAFWWTVKNVMSVAQKLYEAWLITYMRTDSTSLSWTAINQCKELIVSKFGSKYHTPRQYKPKSKNAQEAHEAVRPTDISVEANQIKWTDQEKKLYDLIWKRTLSSQMSDATFTNTTYVFTPIIK